MTASYERKFAQRSDEPCILPTTGRVFVSTSNRGVAIAPGGGVLSIGITDFGSYAAPPANR